MRLADGNDNVFDLLMNDSDRIVYNLFYLIRSDRSSFIVTDDKYYIYAQNSRRAPHWLFIKSIPDEKSFEELVAVIAGMIKLNPLLEINGNAEYLRPILDAIAERYNMSYSPVLNMEVYSATNISPIAPIGKMIQPSEIHRQIITDYVRDMSDDKTGYFTPTEDIDKFVSSLINSTSLYLWENEKIVSMARVAHKTNKFARINTVFTDDNSRGKGYTRMLIGQVTESIFKDGLTPVIYADVTDKDLTDAYTAIGYKSFGNITQFAFN